MRRRIATAIAGLLVVCPVASRAVSVGDAILEWNQIAFAATANARQDPVPQLRSMTIVQVAMHDAVNLITRKHRTYLSYGGAPIGASAEAAAIVAAYETLRSLFPHQTSALDTARAASLMRRRLAEHDTGIVVGKSVAAAILATRADDGAAQAQFAFTAKGRGTPGVWMAIDNAPALLPGWGKVTPWVVRDAAQFRPHPPPSLESSQWAHDYNEVKRLGSSTSATRTAEQTELARFWLASPTTIWNGVARKIIVARGLDISDTARALALLYLAGSDAALTCWNAKYTFNFWRPQHAIRHGGRDGNDDTVPDPEWTPLFATPPHPEYPSGHATNSSALATVLQLLFGEDPGVPIVAISPTNAGFRRTWTRFSEGPEEVIHARIYAGLHYRTADEEGARVGREVARFVFAHALR